VAGEAKIPTKQLGSQWKLIEDTISASSSKTIDTVVLSNFKSIKYIITVLSTAESKIVGEELLLVYNGSTLTDTVYGKVGLGISFDLDANIDGSNMEIDFTNNESFDVEAKLMRLITN